MKNGALHHPDNVPFSSGANSDPKDPGTDSVSGSSPKAGGLDSGSGAAAPAAVAGDDAKNDNTPEYAEILDPCTVLHPINQGFIDLRGISALGNDGKAVGFTTRGYEKHRNFTLGICSTPFKKEHDIVDGFPSSQVGAHYYDPKLEKYISLGEFSTKPTFKGKKLVLTYTNGSYCDSLIHKDSGERVRRSTIITFTCDREILSKAHVSYIGSAHDCSYFFEVRSHHACPTAPQVNNLAVIWIFLFILLSALVVYSSGGLLYKYLRNKQTKI
ncbi:Cation-independent mannose-6-phosphate receptor CI-MPR [Scheffersomyces spartinae]|uniref:Cation-independent mannose-6-phosphate receptor CI-MPR n=1 Tax=Scheffersomyces spartinae TaxID=45513 RepID=A0A9P7V634_9ASCO|nr:Cation-independent mannose-6-phosphate receptor CI-MPR [Scheffersomyces spartinae]KAG7192049.1 Cation-independent mannose-6-phosphate receptor CI-MPR [Scheffersomyces spartinae]